MKASIQSKLEHLTERYDEIARLLGEAEVISDQEQFRKLSIEYSQLEQVALGYRAYQQTLADLETARELLADPEMKEMAEEELAGAREKQAEQELSLQKALLPKDPHDSSNIFLEVRAGTGGDEAAIFAGDLFRMYSRYAEQQRWQLEVISASDGEHGGYKEIIARISGNNVYSRLKFESGAHRVQRVPETESQGRIHTSAATVAIMPEVDEVEAKPINPAELRVDTYRASGAGGQHVNKTESAVRITHIPTNTVVQCQNGRSQHQNRDTAFKQLKAKLYELEMQKRNAEKQALEESKSDIGWGSQIRSYVLDQSRIKDLRTGVETANTQAVLDGDLDRFIEASLKSGL
ncbi:MAG: peptide chain release factor 1 [Thiolinea sp.]